MQRGCTAVRGVVADGVALECPVSLGANFEKVGIRVFLKTRMIFSWRGIGWRSERPNTWQSTANGGCGVFNGLHKAEHDQ